MDTLTSGAFKLNEKTLRKICRENNMYANCPELNDVLHLQCRGILKIENLEAYTGLKAIYFNSNAISDIEGLDALAQLRCLYLENNLLDEVGEGLAHNLELNTLDVANNRIKTVDGLAHLKKITTLNFTQNRIRTKADLVELAQLPELRSLDLSKNKIDDMEAVELLWTLPLSLLKLEGNPVVNQVKSYRKSMIAHMPTLKYLDDSPVFPKDRRLAEAYLRGGLEEEKAERARMKEEEKENQARIRQEWDTMIAEAKEKAENEPPRKGMCLRFKAPEAIRVREM